MSRLNLDVLREICGFLTAVRDVLSVSRTCSTLPTVAVERRLSMRPIIIDRAQSLRYLYNFVFVDKERRGPHIRAIAIPESISHKGLSEDLADLFLAVLASATSLRTLTLYVPGEPSSLFTVYPSVLLAIAGFTSLQELEITASIDVVSLLLGSTHSALKTFRYQPTYEEVGPDSDSDDVPSPQLLSMNIAPHLAPMLEEIQVASDFIIIASRSHVSFPAVRSVILADPADEEVFHWQMDVLLTLFPNLDRTLIIDIMDISRFTDGDVFNVTVGHNDRLVALRGKNHGAQKTRAWKALDRVTAWSIDVLYALGLACPIRHLTLKLDFKHPDEDLDFDAQGASNVHAILQECTPTHLVLFHGGVYWRGSPSPYWNSLFAENVVARLTHLVLYADYWHYASILARQDQNPPADEVETERPWTATLDSLLSGLKSLRRLTHVRILMSAQILYTLNPRFESVSIYDGLREFKFDRVLAVLPNVIPSLSYIFITSRGNVHDIQTIVFKQKRPWDISRAWRVRRLCVNSAGGKHHLEELSAAEAEAVIHAEELYATESKVWGRDYKPDVESEPKEDEEAHA
ncbi:hypothetical protein LXA43DRAFT_1154019 [Ganoderma leucocontextum]|nr:hypothetical protein LXA43DRAFT_1154019 [Ganoderma leucocontextum]